MSLKQRTFFDHGVGLGDITAIHRPIGTENHG